MGTLCRMGGVQSRFNTLDDKLWCECQPKQEGVVLVGYALKGEPEEFPVCWVKHPVDLST